MRYFILMIVILIFSGCNQDSLEKTKELNRKNKLAKIETEKKVAKKVEQKIKMQELKNDTNLKLETIKKDKEEALAKIKAQKEQRIKELELNKAKAVELEKTKQKEIEANSSLELAKINSKTIVEVKEKETSLYKVIAIIVLFIVFIWLVIRYLQALSKRKHEEYLKEQELNYKAYEQESRMKHENISKMLDIISDENSDSAIKKEMAKILSHNKSNLIEYKKK